MKFLDFCKIKKKIFNKIKLKSRNNSENFKKYVKFI
jgi:hypothetical protein